MNLSEKEKELLVKIRKHLGKLHTDWENDPEKDGHCKSNEGYVGVLFRYPNWFESENYENEQPTLSMVEVYSYLFGPSRLHQYDTIEQAWEDVKNW